MTLMHPPHLDHDHIIPRLGYRNFVSVTNEVEGAKVIVSVTFRDILHCHFRIALFTP